MTAEKDPAAETIPTRRTEWMRAPETRAVMEALAARGQPARFVGGCVRDSLAGRAISDIDIATPMRPQDVAEAAQAAGLKAVPTGIDHGTVTIVADGRPFEVTTLRRDVETDGPACRRGLHRGLAGGCGAAGVLRSTPCSRMRAGGCSTFSAAPRTSGMVTSVSSAMRGGASRRTSCALLRYFRFYAQFGKPPPDPDALAACRAMAPRIETLSGERVRVEVFKLLETSDPVPAWRLMAESGAAEVTIGETSALDRLAGLVSVETSADPLRRLVALLSSGREQGTWLADRMRLSRNERDRLTSLAGRAPVDPTTPHAALRRWIYRRGNEAVRDEILLAWADAPGDRRYGALLDQAERWTPPRFPLRGRDAAALGVSAGPEMGGLLDAIEEDWVAGDFKAGRRALLAELKRRVRAGK